MSNFFAMRVRKMLVVALLVAIVLLLAVYGVLYYRPLAKEIGQRFRKGIYGTVVDAATGKPIAGVWIHLLGLGNTRTDLKGYFNFDEIEPGKQAELFFWAIDYQRNAKMAYIKPGNRSVDMGRLEMLPDTLPSWPISDKVKNGPEIGTNFSIGLPQGYKPYRTVRPPEIPRLQMTGSGPRRAIDRAGGEWVLFDVFYNSPEFITYVNPNGAVEKSCVTDFRGYTIDSLKAGVGNIEIYGSADWGYSKPTTIKRTYTIEDLRKDSDSDSIPDRYEIECGLDPHNADTDGDGISDLDDPMPTIAKEANPSDTTAALAACLENRDWLAEIQWTRNNSLREITSIFPSRINMMIYAKAASMGKYSPIDSLSYLPYLNDERSFEDVLLNMTPDEVNRIYPFLVKADKERKNWTFHYSRFPYLKYLKGLNESNWEEIKGKIINSIFVFFIVPELAPELAIEYKAQPNVTLSMYLPMADSMTYEQLREYKFKARTGLELKRLNSDAAIVHKGPTEYQLVKRNGKWIVVGTRQLYII